MSGEEYQNQVISTLTVWRQVWKLRHCSQLLKTQKKSYTWLLCMWNTHYITFV